MNLRLARLRLVLPLFGGAAFLLGACGGDEASTSPPNGSGGSAGTATANKGGAAGASSAGTAGASGGGAKGGSAGASAGTAGSTAAGSAGSGGVAGGKKPGAACAQDAECSLTGIETQPAGCAEAFCDAGVCALRAIDSDGDTFRKKICKLVSDGNFNIALGGDCDDANKDVNPKGWDGPAGDGQPNHCGDGVDQDCSGADGDAVTTTGASCSCVPGDVEACAQTDGGVPIVYPGGSPAPGSSCTLGSRTCAKDPATGGGKWGPCGGAQGPTSEVCNNKDDDCDGQTDEDDAQGKLEWAYDGDADGYRATKNDGTAFATRSACAKPVGTPPECDASYCGAGVDLATCCPPDRWRLGNTASSLDCDDRDGKVNPVAPEICSNATTDKDDNCNGSKDEQPAIGAELWFLDEDGDGYGDKQTAPVTSCKAPGPGWKTALSNTDCDDKAQSINPGVAENCASEADDNCNGSTRDGCSCTAGDPPLDCGAPTDCVYLPKYSVCENGAYKTCPAPVPKRTYCADLDDDASCNRDACVDACAPGTKSPLSQAADPPAKHLLRENCPTVTDCNDANGAIAPSKKEICGSFDAGADTDCDGAPDNGYDLGSACDVGSGTGACKGAGIRSCGSAETPACTAPTGANAVPSSNPKFGAAPNGSRDWNCNNKLDRGLVLPGATQVNPTQYPPNFQDPTLCIDVIDEGTGGVIGGGGPGPQAASPAPWTKPLCIHPTPDGSKYVVPTCAQLSGAACAPHYFFEDCRQPVGIIFDGKVTCNDTCGKYVRLLNCKLSNGACTGSVTNPLNKAYLGCY